MRSIMMTSLRQHLTAETSECTVTCPLLASRLRLSEQARLFLNVSIHCIAMDILCFMIRSCAYHVHVGCTAGVDLVVLVDGSSSVGSENFDVIKQFVFDVTKQFQVSIERSLKFAPLSLFAFIFSLISYRQKSIS